MLWFSNARVGQLVVGGGGGGGGGERERSFCTGVSCPAWFDKRLIASYRVTWLHEAEAAGSPLA